MRLLMLREAVVTSEKLPSEHETAPRRDRAKKIVKAAEVILFLIQSLFYIISFLFEV